MAVIYYDNEDDFDDAFERMEELNYQYLSLKENVEEIEKDLQYAKKELNNFIEDNKDYLIL